MAFYRDHPIVFGVLIGLAGTSVIVFAATRYPSIGALMTGNWEWIRFGAFTVVIFPLAIAHLGPRHGSAIFWIVIGVIFVIHMALFIAIIRYVRQLTALDYTIYGPIEALAFAIIIPRATHALRTWTLSRGSPSN